MANENVEAVRTAYEAYVRGDRSALLDLVDPDLEWTYLDPGLEEPAPQVCRGRHEVEAALERQAERGLRSELEEVVGNGDRVMVAVRTPGVDAYRARPANDRNYDVLTLRDGRIVALRACRDRAEALELARVR